MESRVTEHIAPKQPVAETSEREGTSADRNWLEAELLACGVPEFGLDQWLRHFMEDALATDMSDEKLLNFFCLARDKALSDDEDFVNILTQTEDVLFARMSSNRPETGEDTERMGYEPDEHADAIEALCGGNLTDSQLVELFDLSATLRAEPGVGHMWLAVMFLSRTQILRRMKHARRRKAPDNEELPAHNPDPTDSSCSTDSLEPVGQKNYSAQLQQMRPIVDLPVIPWMTHAYEVAELAFREDMPDGQLLDLVQLADWMRNYEHNCQTHDEWDSMRCDAANMIVRRMLGKDCAPLSDKWPYDTRSWRLNEFRDADHRLPGLDGPTLVHLYIQTGENAFLCAREPLQAHWENVGAHCRAEILKRIGAIASSPVQIGADVSLTKNVDESGTEDGDEDDVRQDEQRVEVVSTREALRIAEETFRPDISDAQLLELYVLTEDNSNPDEDVFDEIAEEVSHMVWDRLRKGAPDPEFERHLENFDYPDHGKQALKAILKGRLPHRNLLMLYRLCWDSTDPTWLAVQDLCRGQILRRMTPPQEREGRDYQRWRQLQLTRRVQLYR